FHLPAHIHSPVQPLHLWLLSLRLARVPTSASSASWIRPSPSSARRLASATTSLERASNRQNQSSSSGAKNERRTQIGVPSRRICAAEERARAAASAGSPVLVRGMYVSSRYVRASMRWPRESGTDPASPRSLPPENPESAHFATLAPRVVPLPLPRP